MWFSPLRRSGHAPSAATGYVLVGSQSTKTAWARSSSEDKGDVWHWVVPWWVGYTWLPEGKGKLNGPSWLTATIKKCMFIICKNVRNSMKKLACKWNSLLSISDLVMLYPWLHQARIPQLSTLYYLESACIAYTHTQTMKKTWNKLHGRITGDTHTISPPLCR